MQSSQIRDVHLVLHHSLMTNSMENSRSCNRRLITPPFCLVAMCCFCGITPTLLATDAVVVGSVRVQMLSSSLVRLESAGAEEFENRNTFHVVNRNWPGTSFSSNLVSGMVVIVTPNYIVNVPQGATSLAGTYVASPAGQVLYQYAGTLTNNVWLPGPSDSPTVLSFADTPRFIPPPRGVVPAPAGSPLIATKSAGFCELDVNRHWTIHGGSLSIGCQARPEDVEILEELL